jgi:hypothetical protein
MHVEPSLKHALGIAILVGAWTCPAQKVTLGLGPTRGDNQPSIGLPALRSCLSRTPPMRTAAAAAASASLSAPTSSAPTPPSASDLSAPAQRGSRTLDTRYFLLNSLHFGLAGFDVAMTQHCIADQHCREANPLMPRSSAGQLTVSFAAVGYSSFISFWLRKHRSHFWWTAPLVGIAAHSAGLATGLAHH